MQVLIVPIEVRGSSVTAVVVTGISGLKLTLSVELHHKCMLQNLHEWNVLHS